MDNYFLTDTQINRQVRPLYPIKWDYPIFKTPTELPSTDSSKESDIIDMSSHKIPRKRSAGSDTSIKQSKGERRSRSEPPRYIPLDSPKDKSPQISLSLGNTPNPKFSKEKSPRNILYLSDSPSDSPRESPSYSPRNLSSKDKLLQSNSPRNKSLRQSSRSNSPQSNSPRSNSPRSNSPQSNSPQSNSPQSNSPHDDCPRSRSVGQSPRDVSIKDKLLQSDSPRSKSLGESPRDNLGRTKLFIGLQPGAPWTLGEPLRNMFTRSDSPKDKSPRSNVSISTSPRNKLSSNKSPRSDISISNSPRNNLAVSNSPRNKESTDEFSRSKVSISKSPRHELCEIKVELCKDEEIMNYSFANARDEYKSDFEKIEHTIYICNNSDHVIFFVISDSIDSKGIMKGQMFDALGRTHFSVSKDTDMKKHLRQKYNNVKKIKSNPIIVRDLINHEKKHTFMVETMDIGVIYGKRDQQHTMSMLKNNTNHISKYFRNFMNLMGIPEYNPNDIYHDIHCGIKTRYYSAVFMGSEVIRQHIGNCRCIIIFKEYNGSIDLSEIDLLGLVNTFFIIIEPVIFNKTEGQDPLYRIGFCQRVYNQDMLPITIPKIPTNAVFEAKDIKDIILTKFASCTVNDKLEFMYAHPRKISLNELAHKHISTL